MRRVERLCRSAQPQLRAADAFTLVEVLIATILIGLAATLLSASLLSATDTARLHGAQVDLESALRSARYWSRLHHAHTWLEIDRRGQRWRWVRTRANGAPNDWHILRGVQIERVALDATPQSDGRSAESASKDRLILRIGPSGVALPWRVELRAGARLLKLQHDGLSDSLQRVVEERP